MGLFDPPYKNILTKSPPAFVSAIASLEPGLLAELDRREVPRSGINQFLTVIYGRVALGLLQLYPGWTDKDFRFIFTVTQNAERMFPKMYQGQMLSLSRQAWEVVASSYGDETTRVTDDEVITRAYMRASNLPVWNMSR